MLKVHVTPLTPAATFEKYLKGHNVLINWLRPDDLKRANKVCNKIFIDNGAYTFWRKKLTPDYSKFYKWLETKTFDHFFIPDDLNGSEEINDLFLKQVPEVFKPKAIAVFHINQSLERLKRLVSSYDYIAIGGFTGIYSNIGSPVWFARMDQIMKILCDKDGKPLVKIHALKCLNPKVFIYFPFTSADSSNLARNHFKVKGGIETLLKRLDCFQAPKTYEFIKTQVSIFDLLELIE